MIAHFFVEQKIQDISVDIDSRNATILRSGWASMSLLQRRGHLCLTSSASVPGCAPASPVLPPHLNRRFYRPLCETLEDRLTPSGTHLDLAPSLTTAVYGQSINLTATLTADDGSAPTGIIHYYDNETPLGQALLNGVSGNDQSTLDISRFAVGGHALYVTFDGNSVYEPSVSDMFAVTVTPAVVTVNSLTADSKVYDGTSSATLSFAGATLSGVLSGDNVALDGSSATAAFVSANVGSGVGVSVSGLGLTGADAGNYVLDQPTDLTADITPAVLTVTADNQSKTYGDSDPALTYQVSGLVGSDSLSGSLSRDSGEPVGSYAINQGSLAASSNYTVSFTAGIFTIAAAAEPPVVSAVADQQNGVGDWVTLAVSAYDPASAPLTYSAVGLPDGLGIDSGTGVISGTVTSSASTGTPFQVTVDVSNGVLSAETTFSWFIHQVTLSNPGDQDYLEGDPVSLPLQASDSVAGDPLTFSAQGLPQGLAIDPQTGVISGVSSAALLPAAKAGRTP